MSVPNCSCVCPGDTTSSSRSRGLVPDPSSSTTRSLLDAFATGSRSALVGIAPSPIERSITGTYSSVPRALSTPFNSFSVIDWVPSGMLSRDYEDERSDEASGDYTKRRYFPLQTPPSVPGRVQLSCPCVVSSYGSHGPGSSYPILPSASRTVCLAWDGLPVINPCGKTREELFFAIWPGASISWAADNRSPRHMIGLEVLYNRVKPFTDELNPSIGEFYSWNIQVINHWRYLMYNSNPAVLDQRLMNEALWYLERLFGTYYGSTTTEALAYSFIPSLVDQGLYYLGTPSSTRKNPTTEQWYTSDSSDHWSTSIPWWTLMSTILQRVTYGWHHTPHFSSMFGRSEIGVSFILNPSDSSKQDFAFTYAGSLTPICS